MSSGVFCFLVFWGGIMPTNEEVLARHSKAEKKIVGEEKVEEHDRDHVLIGRRDEPTILKHPTRNK